MKQLLGVFHTWLLAATRASGEVGGDPAKAWNVTWTAPLVVLAAFLVAWAAEAAQFLMSQGLALAILAWLQTLPEFAVEADLAWGAARGTYEVHLVTANFTGSIRIIMGLGMPIVYFIYSRFWSRERRHSRPIVLDAFHSVEIINLFPPVIYFVYILYKGSLDLVDSVVMLCFYAFYLGMLIKMPPEEEEDISEMPAVSQWVLRRGRKGRIAGVAGIFVLGGIVLFLVVHPFVVSLNGLGVALGISTFILIQWVAPILSEMPEKVSAFNWARRENRAAMALMNFLCSNLNQLTVLVAMVPIVFAVSGMTAGRGVGPIEFDFHQSSEVLLTVCQALLCLVLLLNMKFEWWDAAGMFALFMVQFLAPAWEGPAGIPPGSVRAWIVFCYLGWVFLEVVLFLAGVRAWRFPMRRRSA